MVNDPCSKCISSDVCEYKDKFFMAKQDLDDNAVKYKDFNGCSYFM